MIYIKYILEVKRIFFTYTITIRVDGIISKSENLM